VVQGTDSVGVREVVDVELRRSALLELVLTPRGGDSYDSTMFHAVVARTGDALETTSQ